MVTIIIPNYNGLQYLKDCLEALMPQVLKPDRHVLVVDNGSTDGSVEFLRQYPGIEMIFLEKNTGFCGAVNIGITKSRTRYVILLNNDTKVCPGYVQALVDSMERDSRLFSVSARMLMMQDPTRMDNAGDIYTALGYAKGRGIGRPASEYDRPADVFSACGGAAIYRRAVFDEIGLFDETHFAYLEDVDIGYRARIYGYRNAYCPEARVEHAGSGFSGSRYNAFKVSLASRNSVYLPWKNMPLLQLLLNLPLLLPGYAVKTVFFCRKGLGSQYVKGLFEGVKLCARRENRCHKVPFRWSRLMNYVKIQLRLWINLFYLLRE
ncbi:MAG: glycosyltransferase family 2 protein [Lachnospiraceae bacterium]|nr:glycosyltransferase family 2 protein [Lachnospiraceae bacterium]